MTYREAVEARRSIRRVNKNMPVDDETLIHLVKDALLLTPSGYNMQAVRLLLLLGDEHDSFWKETYRILSKGREESANAKTRKKLDGFQNGYGTILFFDDMDVVHGLEENMPKYAEQMRVWAQQSQGMLQYVVWTGLEELGCGASLQHYNPLVNEMVTNLWNVPKNWILQAQMPFGGKDEAPSPRAQKPVDERLMIAGK